MGASENQQPHEERSSSMTFAMRWKRENLRLISTISIISCAMLLMFLVLFYGTATKSVSVVVNGQEQVYKTKQKVLSHLLDEQGIKVAEYDRVSAPLDSEITNGSKIEITLAKPFQLTADGETRTVYTTETTVQGALSDQHITIGENDKVTPSLETTIASDISVKVVRVTKEVQAITESVAYKVEKQNDSQLLKGKEQVVQEGKEGILVKQKENVYEDGVLVSEAIVGEEVTVPSINKIVAVGTKNPVTVASTTVSKEGLNFGYKQILNNVSITAYAAGASSTGKAPGHPQYGITSSGAKATEGRTIAVDPSVIPMGWWVYIDGIGFRRAEDTGSSVKGKHIDVYYSNEAYANKFGRKSGFTVYVIGPNKPAEN